MDAAIAAAQLHHHLDGEGRLVRFPSRRQPRLWALLYLASRFEAGRSYSEAEVNDLLDAAHTFHDPATLRRELYDRGFLERERDGSRYWLAAEPPTPATLGLVGDGA
jgi:hypothetical protein